LRRGRHEQAGGDVQAGDGLRQEEVSAMTQAAHRAVSRSTMLSAASYVDAGAYERERARIFAREWTFVADEARLAAPGGYVASTIAGYPIVVINDAGTLRGFHNVCRHRGGPLVWEGEGSCKTLVCRYHGWSYGLDGSLQGARDFGDEELRRDELSLHAVRVETWRGLVFANLDRGAPALLDWLGGFAGECEPYPMETFRPVHRSSHDLVANWKVYAENYQEGYHIPLVHPGLNRQIDARQYEVDVRDGYCVHRAPTRDGGVTAGTWLWRFPGLALNLYPNGMCVESYAPTGPAETRIEYAFFFAEGTPDDEIQASIASSNTILDEDRVICEAVQRNYASGLYGGGLLSPRHEGGVAYVQELVLKALGSDV
jgi:choline monooxygenase